MPLCAACAIAEAHRRMWKTFGSPASSIRRKSDDKPGAGTSCDHIVSQQSGLMPQSSGILTKNRFWGSTLFVDHYSDFIHNHLITGTSSSETYESKKAYERVAATYGVKIKSYHGDNLRFNDKLFVGDCEASGQNISFCGVGAHHQNAIAERKIKEITYGARTVLLHAKRKWPKVIKTVLWPYAMQSVVERHNKLSLHPDGKSPLEKFSGIADDIRPSEFHTWGCPVYILEADNQNIGIGTPKWEPRAHAGIYLGHSPCHAGSVALVMNLRTGLVSPQFHVVFDDEFSTVPYLYNEATPPNWDKLFEHCSEHATDTQEKVSEKWLHPPVNVNIPSEGDTPNDPNPPAPGGG